MFTRYCTILICLLMLSLTGSNSLQAQSASVPDLGDAPDSTNSVGMAMTAYSGVNADFPTVFDPAIAPFGPKHSNGTLRVHLGEEMSAEEQADAGADADPLNNILPAFDGADRDGKDDGLIIPADWPHCQRIRIKYVVNVVDPIITSAIVNIWSDFQRDGTWQQNAPATCSNGATAPDWASLTSWARASWPCSCTPALL